MEKKRTSSQATQAAQSLGKLEKQRPIHVVVMPFNGSQLRAAIWRHESKEGNPRFSVSLSHAHRSASGKWIYGDRSFTRDQLIGLVRVIEVAHGHIVTGHFDEGENNE